MDFVQDITNRYMRTLLWGRPVADAILQRIRRNIAEKVVFGGSHPVFSAILVGDDPASHIYVRLKEEASRSVGIEFRKTVLRAGISQESLLGEVRRLNRDASVHGILVQLPLPEHLDMQAIIDALDPKKDVDGFHPENIRLFLEGRSVLEPVFPRAVVELAQSSGQTLCDRRAVVIGNSETFGRIMCAALAREEVSAEFIHCDSLASAAASVLAADMLVTACGAPGLITGSMIKDGAMVIDGGIVAVGDKVVGDVDKESMGKKDIFLSPVPGGVGPVTIACLLENVCKAWERAHREFFC
jgi:methylenetetrahydrofolate dehydrogenase (NADP+)/methenyltetrahydrofolate cyclohydrolase